MAELPSSWNLTTRLNATGKAEVRGKDDAGHDYTVRTCDSPEISDKDVAEIAAVDRERTTAHEFVSNLCEEGRRRNAARESEFHDDLTDAAGPVVHAGFERRGSSVGYSRTYARNFDKVFNGE